MTEETNRINITGEPSVDPQVCKFIVDRPIYENGTITCRDAETAQGSPLLEALFEIEGISQVMVSGNSITLAKSVPTPWPELGGQIGAIIREKIQSGEKLIDPEVSGKAPSEEKIRQVVQQLFEQQINPMIASHGGRVELADVEGTRVFVRLAGGCQGCSSANATLKHGIEKAIKETIPEVTEVVDATDHTAGTDPFYK